MLEGDGLARPVADVEELNMLIGELIGHQVGDDLECAGRLRVRAGHEAHGLPLVAGENTKAGAEDAGTRRWVRCGLWVGQLSFCGSPPRGVSEAPLDLAVRGAKLGHKALPP